MPHTMDEARRLLRHHFGYPDFRHAQRAVIRSVLERRDTLAVLPTGAGKSICFQLPALVLGGLTVVVSPLIALMQDQVSAAVARGIAAAGLHSALESEVWDDVWARLRAGTVRLLYVSPERLSTLASELREATIRPSLLAVDEAHCVTEWGPDFRPAYRALGASRFRLGRPHCLALTGSATPGVRADIARVLRFIPGRFAEHLGSFDRPNLWFGVARVRSEPARFQTLLRLLKDDDRMAIVYAPTRAVTESLARALAQAGHRAAPYHAGLSKQRRTDTLKAFLDDRVDLIVATCAFGMGIDKPQVRLVVHWTLPATPEAYYQEAGRAGRDGAFARCVLLWRPGDAALHRRQLDVTFPPRELLERIWKSSDTLAGVPANVRASAQRLRHELRPESGEVDWGRVRERRRRAEGRIAAVESYAKDATCRRRALLGYFGERLGRCAGCDRCSGQAAPLPSDPVIAARFTRLRRALAGCRAAWDGCVLEPDVMLRLSQRPPVNVSALADVAGVGPAIAERLGGTILAALGDRAVPGSPRKEDSALSRALRDWRARTAAVMGVPEFTVLGDRAIDALAEGAVRDRSILAQVPGIGPRALAKFGNDLLRIVAEASKAPR